MKGEGFNFDIGCGLSGQEKKRLKILDRKRRLEERNTMIENGETYGDTKVSRRIPREIATTVMMRDTGRDFGRPDHSCKNPGQPHHIVHFEKFLNKGAEGSPHTTDNLECPCAECHKLAHEMNIPSGVSIETFFRQKFNNPK